MYLQLILRYGSRLVKTTQSRFVPFHRRKFIKHLRGGLEIKFNYLKLQKIVITLFVSTFLSQQNSHYYFFTFSSIVYN